jgi:hypothetical protein
VRRYRHYKFHEVLRALKASEISYKTFEYSERLVSHGKAHS